MRAAPDCAMIVSQRSPTRGPAPACALATICVLLLCGCNTVAGHVNNQVGMQSYERGNYIAAGEAFRRAAADDPRNPAFVFNLACAIQRQGDFPLAERTYVQSIALDPTYQAPYHGLARLLVDEGRQAEATQLISTWAAGQRLNAGAQIEMAWIQRLNGDRLGAERSLFRALAIEPNHPIATAQLGQLYQEGGHPERAIPMYERSLQRNWLQPQVEARLDALRSAGAWSAPPPVLASSPAFPVEVPSPRAASRAPYEETPTDARANDDPAHVQL
jgi:Tfp pilus assembly protein PilF